MMDSQGNNVLFKGYGKINSFNLKHHQSGDQMVNVSGEDRFPVFETCFLVLASICKKTSGCSMLRINCQLLNTICGFRNIWGIS